MIVSETNSRFWFALSLGAALIVTTGCEEAEDTSESSSMICTFPGKVTYENSVAEVAEVYCAGCHTADAVQPQPPLFVDEWRTADWSVGTGEVSPEWFGRLIDEGVMPISQGRQLEDTDLEIVDNWLTSSWQEDTGAVDAVRVTDYDGNTFEEALSDLYESKCYTCHGATSSPLDAPHFSSASGPRDLDYDAIVGRFSEVAYHGINDVMPKNVEPLSDDDVELFDEWSYRVTRNSLLGTQAAQNQEDSAWADVEELFDSRCIVCHSSQNGSSSSDDTYASDFTGGTFVAVDRDTVTAKADTIESYVASGYMPKQISSLDNDDKDLLSAWRDAVFAAKDYGQLRGSVPPRIAVSVSDDGTGVFDIDYVADDSDDDDLSVGLYYSTSNEVIDGWIVEDCLPGGDDSYVWDPLTTATPASDEDGYYLWACVSDGESMACDFADERVVVTE